MAFSNEGGGAVDLAFLIARSKVEGRIEGRFSALRLTFDLVLEEAGVSEGTEGDSSSGCGSSVFLLPVNHENMD
jgi:hypothetical protein